jgi:hypothetical protein
LSAVLDADRYLSPHRYSIMPKSGSRRYSMKAPPRFPAGLIESAHALDGLSAVARGEAMAARRCEPAPHLYAGVPVHVMARVPENLFGTPKKEF